MPNKPKSLKAQRQSQEMKRDFSVAGAGAALGGAGGARSLQRFEVGEAVRHTNNSKLHLNNALRVNRGGGRNPAVLGYAREGGKALAESTKSMNRAKKFGRAKVGLGVAAAGLYAKGIKHEGNVQRLKQRERKNMGTIRKSAFDVDHGTVEKGLVRPKITEAAREFSTVSGPLKTRIEQTTHYGQSSFLKPKRVTHTISDTGSTSSFTMGGGMTGKGKAALAATGAGSAAAGYARKKKLSKSAFDVDHEIEKFAMPKIGAAAGAVKSTLPKLKPLNQLAPKIGQAPMAATSATAKLGTKMAGQGGAMGRVGGAVANNPGKVLGAASVGTAAAGAGALNRPKQRFGR